MKVMAINSSLRTGGQSRTEVMLNHLVSGMREAGAEVGVVHLRKKKIKYCIGCYSCMTKTPGKCAISDDMTEELLPRWLESDLVIYATPLFHHTVNAPMKTFIERTWPVCMPFFEKHSGEKLIAEIYRPAAMNMTQRGLEDARDDILESTRQAGRELIESGTIASETMARITRRFADEETIAEMGSLYWKTCIAEGITPRIFEQERRVPRPESLESFMTVMQMGFNVGAVRDSQVILQFTLSGEVEGSCYFTIGNGGVEATLGTAEEPDLTIDTPFELWMDIVTGKADGQQLFMDGKYRAEGNISLMSVFSPPSDQETGSPEDELTEKDAVQSTEMNKQRLTCRGIISGMPTVFNSEAAGDLAATIYYRVTGEDPGDYYLEIADGICTFHEGKPSSPTLTIETPSDVWVAISVGELNGRKAFMKRKYKASGATGLLMKLDRLFSSD
jgi:multimeric flavodoxin WrbA/putative sterol carrier protein